MNFGNLPAVWGLLGLAAIAGVLYMLQRLRVRHRLVEVETTMFWQKAMEESRARVLVQRFRHPWAYALILLIAAFLWLSIAGLRTNADEKRDHLVLIDGSAGMAVAERFAEAVELATGYSASLPEHGRTVVLCGGQAKTLLRPGEENLLLAKRLADAVPQAAPNSVARTLRTFVAAQSERALSVCIVGDSPLTQVELEQLPDGVDVTQLKVAERTAKNAGITALGVRAAVSGQWANVDVLLDVRHISGAAATAPQLLLEAAAWTGTPTTESLPDGVRYRFADVPAAGQTLTASLAGGDALTADDRASFVLPDRRPIAVAVEPAVAAVFRRVIDADPGLSLQAAATPATRAVVRSVGSTFGGDLPAIELSDPAASDDAFLVFHPEDLDPGAVLDELYRGLGLNEIDAMATAEAIGRSITMGAKPDATKKLWVWRQLLEPDYDFVNSRSFPLFVGLGVRWLVGFDAGPERTAVAEAVSVNDRSVKLADGSAQRSFADSFVPAAAGAHQVEGGQRFIASLLDPAATGAASSATAADLPAAGVASRTGHDLVTVLLLLALGLLVAEWVLYRTARIP